MGFLEAVYKEIGENDHNQDVSDWLTTGYPPLNRAISGRYDRGFPVGRIIEIYGGESSGKTMLATQAMVETQQKGGVAMMLDFEHAFSLSRAVTLGLNPDGSWIYKQPETAEKGFGMIEKALEAVRKHDPDIYLTVVVDSVSAMIPKAELEAGFEDQNMKTRLALASCMSTALKRLQALISRNNATLIFLNQTRTNPGVMFGDSEDTTGGKSLKFYASVRLRLSKGTKLKEGGEIFGVKTTVQTHKNKVFEPFKKAEYVVNFKDGLDRELSCVMALNSMGMLGSAKGWVEFEGRKYRQAELVRSLKEDPAMFNDFLTLFERVDSEMTLGVDGNIVDITEEAA